MAAALDVQHRSPSSSKHSGSTNSLASVGAGKVTVTDLTPALVGQFLKLNPQFLENYVTNQTNVPKDVFQRWQSKRAHKDGNTKTNGTKKRIENNDVDGKIKSDDFNQSIKRKVLLDLSTDTESCGNKNQLIYELMSACVMAVKADGGHLYLLDKDTQEIYFYDSDKAGEPQPSRRYKPAVSSTVSAYVARTLESVRTSDISKDVRFPDGLGVVGIPCQSVLCHPLVDTSGVFLGVVEIYKNKGNSAFTDRDQELVMLLSIWGCLGIYFSQNFAQKLVNADRASLFLVDSKTNELYARIFDVGTGTSEVGNLDINGQKEIRFPIDRGIAGFVASGGQVLNIEDAYTDDRFNRDVDLKTGYTTKTILCMPIFNRGSIIGVVQMVNKHSGVFTKHDEDAFETFAVYCGLALHHAKLYDKIRRSEQKYRVALEVLAYHSVCNREEVAKLKKHEIPKQIPMLESFDVHPHTLSEIEKPLYAVYMFKDLFGLQKYSFDNDDLVRFVLTVRKNYRRVAYHNWTHGWSVAHAMFVILRSSNNVFTELEKLAMYISCLCHDLDHRGKNNAYMKNMSTPLASIYSTSVMEHHHFNQTVTILQQEGHNIFRSLSSEDYKWVLGNIKHCILATDLALFFPNKAKLKKIIEDKQLNWDDPVQRLIIQAVVMTGCDLIASAKPWEVQTDTTKVIFEEFYEQGDAERANGNEPIPMMDRHKAHELPLMQVGFMAGICVPCYDLLSDLLPCVKKLLEQAKYNQSKWQELADEQKKRLEAKEAKKGE